MSILIENAVFKLRGKIQHYAWGGYTFIPEFVGLNAETDLPCAEYWMGAHGKAPAEILFDDRNSTTLDTLIADDPITILGSQVAQKYGRLPFLLKVLDVREMLSIQVHPTKAEAELGFASENELGIPLDSPLRNYKDDNHKPEIQLALSDFWLLHGFRPVAELAQVLRETPEFTGLVPIFAEGDYFGLYKYVMELPLEESDTLLSALAARILPDYQAGRLDETSPDYWAGKVISESQVKHYDRGIFSIYFFNLVHLKPGQAQFQDAGIPHALLRGQTIEIMANSDNVIRGGLTPKAIDIPQLLKLVTFGESSSEIIEGQPAQQPWELSYPAPSQEFALSKISLPAGEVYRNVTHSAEIALLYQGEVIVNHAGKETLIRAGESILICADQVYSIRAIAEEAVWFRAYTPLI